MLTRSQTPVKPTRFSKRVSRKIVRLSDEYHKYTSGKYHGWSDTYDRSYNLDRMYDINMDSDEEDEDQQTDYKNHSYHRGTIPRFIARIPDAPLKRRKFTKEGYDTSDGFVMNDEYDVNWSDFENELD